MKLILSLHETRSDQCRIVPVHIEGKLLAELNAAKLWEIFLAMSEGIEKSFSNKKP